MLHVVFDPEGMGGVQIGRTLFVPWWRRPKDVVTFDDDGFVRYGRSVVWADIESITAGLVDRLTFATLTLVIASRAAEIVVSDETDGFPAFLDALSHHVAVDREALGRLIPAGFSDEWPVLYARDAAG